MRRVIKKEPEQENKVSAEFAYRLSKMFEAEAELYKNKCKGLKEKLLFYKQQSIY